MLQNYMACGEAADISDFFSLNVYEWCGDSSYDVSGYSMLEQNATDLNIPIFISETGCNKPLPRLFKDQAAIFGQKMSNTWSGAIIYEWIQEANKYGLISYGTPLYQNDLMPLNTPSLLISCNRSNSRPCYGNCGAGWLPSFRNPQPRLSGLQQPQSPMGHSFTLRYQALRLLRLCNRDFCHSMSKLYAQRLGS